MDKYLIALEEGKFYHIYNQGNNKENIFYNDGNYAYFLKKLDYYLSDFVEVYAFCLMPNHFHLLVRIKTEEELNRLSINRLSKFQKLGKSDEKSDEKNFINNQFRLFFMSYSKSINKQLGRSGSLFRKNFKRKVISNLSYLQQTVIYIHRNPVHHGFDTDYTTYRWSSYDRIMEEKITKLKKKEVLEWFGNKENYCYIHNQKDVEDDIE